MSERRLHAHASAETIEDMAEAYTGVRGYRHKIRWYQFWRFWEFFTDAYQESRCADLVLTDRMIAAIKEFE